MSRTEITEPLIAVWLSPRSLNIKLAVNRSRQVAEKLRSDVMYCTIYIS